VRGSLVAVLFAALLVGEGCSNGADPASGFSHSLVMNRIRFARQLEDGIVEGVNIDSRVSDLQDEQTCNRLDFVSPDGREGIDNGLALLLPFIDLAAGGDPDGLIQGAVNDGSLLLVLEMRGVDGFENDGHLEVRMWSAVGQPLIGTDGWLVPGQSFMPNPERPPSAWAPGSIRDGHLRAGPIDATIPIQVLNVAFDLNIQGGIIEAEMDLEGNASGFIGGGVPLQTFYDVVTAAVNGNAEEAAPLLTFVDGFADLDKGDDGTCHEMSTGLAVEAVPAFIVAADGGV